MRRKGRAERTQRRPKAERAVAPAARVDESGKAHAPLPPSASSRWIACPPSMAYVQMLVAARVIKQRVSGESAKRGTRIHTWGEQFIKWMVLGKKTTGVKGDPGELQEARDYATFCVDQLERAYIITDRSNVQYGVEDRAIVDERYCWGSRDFWFYAADRLTVLDLKSGREPVVIEGNTQLLIYALDKFYELAPAEVELLIWQPNSDEGGDPDRSFVYTAAQMSEHARKINGYVEVARNWFGRAAEQVLRVIGQVGHGMCLRSAIGRIGEPDGAIGRRLLLGS